MAVALAVVLSATLAAPTTMGAVVAMAGLGLLAVRHPAAPAVALGALAIAVGIAVHQGASPAAAPLWGAGLLVAGTLGERAVSLAGDGEVEADALVVWLAGLGALAGGGLAAAALVLLAAATNAGTTALGLAAAALLAVVPAALARRRAREGGRGAG
jgi:hypothetical protein